MLDEITRLLKDKIKSLLNHLRGKKTIPRQFFSHEQLHEHLLINFRCKNEDIYLADKRFYSVDFSIFKRWSDETVEEIKREFGAWSEDAFDCEDFARAYKVEMTKRFRHEFPDKKAGILCGEIWSWYWIKSESRVQAAHAVNFFYDTERQKLMLVEPQNGNVFELPDKWNPYLLIA